MQGYVFNERLEPAKRPVMERIKNFNEIYELYDQEEAQVQSERCIQCGDPYCHNKCPLHNFIPQWLKSTAARDLSLSFALSNESSPFPEIMGRVCPQDRLCEGACTLNDGHGAITIGSIETFISEEGFKAGLKPTFHAVKNGKKVAVIGSGPAGLSAATFLLRNGLSVTMFERANRAGGLLTYGIPSFKLDKSVVARRVEWLIEAGMELKCGVTVGQDISFDELVASYDALFLGIGATKSNSSGLLHEDAENVFMAIDFLTAIQKKLFGEASDAKYDVKGKNVVVIGGGDTAMDCLRTSIREGARSVRCLYRRDAANMPGSRKEYKNAIEEGAEFIFNVAPKALVVDENGHVVMVKMVKTELGEPDEKGRRRIVEVAGSEFDVEADVVIMALGFSPETPSFLAQSGIVFNSWGGIVVDARGMTSRPGVFAGGDAVRGADLVVNAAYDGREVAANIAAYLGV
ncbi:MAG: glutamate synthase subunit beta [Campylobacterales bacterium]